MNTYDAVLAALAAAPITPTPTEQLAAWARVSVSEARQALDLAVERGEVVAHPPGRPGQRWKWSWPEVKPAPAPSEEDPARRDALWTLSKATEARVDALDKRTTKAMDYAGGARSAVAALATRVGSLERGSHLAAIREEIRQVAVGLDAARGRSDAAYERAQEAHAALGRLDPVVAATTKQGESLAKESHKTTSRLAAAEDRLDQVGFDVEKVRRDADATAARLYADFCVAEDDRNTRARRAHDALHNDLVRTQEYVFLLVGAVGASASVACGVSVVVAIATVWGWL